MAIEDGLKRMTELLKLLGDPQSQIKAIHIAGTNGKGSTSWMIASILEEAGYTVGLYTSPHLETYNERIQIWNGIHEQISDEDFDRLESVVTDAGEKISELGPLHIFEKLTAIAFLYYAEMKPDYVILECGLGGRLDSTNTIDKPLVSVITQVGLDHTALLGNTVLKVAREKAGIVKAGVPLVSQSVDYNVQNILARTADSLGAPFYDALQCRKAVRKLKLGMRGKHQRDNAATAVAAIQAAGIPVSEDSIEIGLENAVMPGRFEIVREKPYWILDGGHNPDAVAAAIETLNSFTRANKIQKTLILFGCMKDKNYNRMVQLLCTNARNCDYATVAVDEDRAETAVALGDCFVANGRDAICFNSVTEACDKVRLMDYDCVLIIGSIYLVGAVRKNLS